MRLTASDFLPPQDFLNQRSQIFNSIKNLKKDRRIHLGPDITFYFENKETIQWQIQEMLRIEKGGLEQIQEEIEAYQDLLPQKDPHGHMNLSCTMMIEEGDITRRKILLQELSNIENSIEIQIGKHILKAQDIQDGIQRTNSQGKTSAIHFLKFTFTQSVIQDFYDSTIDAFILSNHPRYGYRQELTANQKQALLNDLKSIEG